MDVSELLAQKRSLLEESAALDEPELTLTAREFDYRLRRAFADRERNVDNQVRKLLDQHMVEVDSKIAAALADIDSRIDAAFEARAWQHEATMEAIGQALGETRKKMRAEFQEQLGLVRADIEIMTKAIERGHDRGTVIDLPAVLPKSRHG